MTDGGEKVTKGVSMTCFDVIVEYLKAHGFDGLENKDLECGCALEDLCPCGSDMSECKPGHKVACSCGEGCDFHIKSGEMRDEGKQATAINIIFDGPPSHESGRFVEVEDDLGHSLDVGEWIHRTDGLWALRITQLPDPGGPGVELLLIDRVAAQKRHREYADGIAAAIGDRPTRNTGEPAYSDREEVIRIRSERDEARALLWEQEGSGPSEPDLLLSPDVEEVECCDECGHLPAVGNVVYEDSGRLPLCRRCNSADALRRAREGQEVDR